MWISIETLRDLEAINEQSFEMPIVILKQSTRCSISRMALKLFESSFSPLKGQLHLLDLLSFRYLSNEIAQQYQVTHQSPQVLVIKNGRCVFWKSHNEIDAHEIQKIIAV